MQFSPTRSRGFGWAALLALGGAACSHDSPMATAGAAADPELIRSGAHGEIRRLAAERGIRPLSRAHPTRPELVALGQALVFDPELSGERDISCMTCHHPTLATGDGRHLAIGRGARGLGPTRVHPDGVFIPRNAPPFFNLHAFDHLFWDGRVAVDRQGRLTTPAGAQLTPEMTKVFEFGALSALGLFPVVSREEMRGFAGNELATIPDGDFSGVWRALMARLGAIPEYRDLFEAAYPGTPFERMTFAHASNAMAGFLLDAFFFDDTPWDRFLRGEDAALTPGQLAGARHFLTARCSICHGGPALTDDQFHNVVLASLGPGQGDGPSGRDDFGRFRVTGDPTHLFAFKTPSLRNVELTGPYGHAGQFVSLRAFIDHYSENDRKLREYDASQLEPLLQGTVLSDNIEQIIATRDPLLHGVVFPDQVIDEVTAFMVALTDERARDLRHLIPSRVPSGLPLDP